MCKGYGPRDRWGPLELLAVALAACHLKSSRYLQRWVCGQEGQRTKSKGKEGDRREGGPEKTVHRILRNHPVKNSMGSCTQEKYECSLFVIGL